MPFGLAPRGISYKGAIRLLERLDKILSQSGKLSRKEAKSAVKEGRVSVNGILAECAEQKIEREGAVILLDGEEICASRHRYFVMNKPKGYVSATEDKKEQTVLELMSDEEKRLGLFPAGRLDKDTTGLLILTNDGNFAHKMLSPKNKVPKLYLAETDENIDESDIAAFKEGITLRDGAKTLPAELRQVGDRLCEIEICEGKYHQVKRMIASRGKRVLSLKRLKIGNFALPKNLSEGRYKEVCRDELMMLCLKNHLVSNKRDN